MGRYCRVEIERYAENSRLNGWKSLTLSGVPVFDSDLRELAREPGIDALTSLNLQGTDAQISAASFQTFFSTCRDLRRLNLAGCTRLGNRALRIVAMHCPALESIDLTGCWRVGDSGIRALAAHCPRLESILLDGDLRRHSDGGPTCVSLNGLLQLTRLLAPNGRLKTLSIPASRLSHRLRPIVRILDAVLLNLGSDPLVLFARLLLGPALLVISVLFLALAIALAAVPLLAAVILLVCGWVLFLCRLALYVVDRSLRPAEGRLGTPRTRFIKAFLVDPASRFITTMFFVPLGLPDELRNRQDAAQILRAVQEILEGGAAPLLEVKAVVLGDGEVGKTQLVNRLLGKPFQTQCDRTRDFEIHRVKLPKVGPAAEDVSVRLYDFGGQPHLWSAHRFFLASRHNLYLVVIDGTRQDHQRLAYWLEYLRHYVAAGGESEVPRDTIQRIHAKSKERLPVLVVISKCDRGAISSEEAFNTVIANAASFADVRLVPKYSSVDDTGLESIRLRLGELTASMSYIFDTRYANTLHEVKRYLERDRRAQNRLSVEPFKEALSIEELNALFAKAKKLVAQEPEPSDCLLWLQILRNLGVVHWVGDVPGVQEGTPIAQTVYDPDWVRKVVYGVICQGLEARLPGIIGDQQLLALLDDAWVASGEKTELSAKRKREVIDLMVACHLTFGNESRLGGRWLVLDWLKDAADVDDDLWTPEFSRIEFQPFLPESLLPRCIGEWFRGGVPTANLSRNRIKIQDPQYPDATALVLASVERCDMRLWLTGGEEDVKWNLDAKVRGLIEHLADAEGLQFQERCFVQMASDWSEGMDYHLQPPFFKIEPQTSFADAWEVFCCEVLNRYEKTADIYRRTPPEGGVDLYWPIVQRAYQCKSVERNGRFSLTRALESLRAAMILRNSKELPWKTYVLCSNVALTGKQEARLRDLLPEIVFLTPTFWQPRCREQHAHVYRRFRVLVDMHNPGKSSPS